MLRRVPLALALACAAGAALRFATLDVQSLWYDEAVTAHLLRMDLPGLLRAIPASESSPPLYYVVAWLWTHVFGTGEVGLRSLSALLGTATIPVVWLLGRRLGGDRAALAGAALAACNPLLVWFSQESRAYALLGLLAALSALLWLRALDAPADARRTLLWGAVAALALATHYYAIFLVAPMMLWLLARAPTARSRLAVVAPPVAAALALAPLALAQRSNDTARFIGETSLTTRVAQIPKQFLVGYDAPRETLLTILLAAALLVGVAGLAALLAGRVRCAARERAAALCLTSVTTGALALAVITALGGEDHLLTRNVLFALPIATAIIGAGLAAAFRRAALAAGGAACLLSVVAIAGVAHYPRMQRDDWRDAAAALGKGPPGRIVVAPGTAQIALGYYVDGLAPAPAGPHPVSAIDYLDLPERRPGALATPRPGQTPAPIAGFAITGRSDAKTFSVVHLRAPAAQPVDPATLTVGLDGGPAVVLVTP